jgi:hypothetical protein
MLLGLHSPTRALAPTYTHYYACLQRSTFIDEYPNRGIYDSSQAPDSTGLPGFSPIMAAFTVQWVVQARRSPI